jgi:uncharacterized protein YdaU (DUF1376 family)
MSERPFMQLYTSDFLGDTQDLSAEYIGSYLLLLMTMWNADGSLAFDEVKLARVARLTVEEWRLAWGDLERFFEVIEGRLTHPRLTFELRKFASKSAARREAGSRGGKAKALKDKNPTLANATAKAIASSRNHIKKAGATLDVPTEKSVRLDRNANGPLFDACLRLTQEKVAGFITGKSFPVSVIAQAQQLLDTESKGAVH